MIPIELARRRVKVETATVSKQGSNILGLPEWAPPFLHVYFVNITCKFQVQRSSPDVDVAPQRDQVVCSELQGYMEGEKGIHRGAYGGIWGVRGVYGGI